MDNVKEIRLVPLTADDREQFIRDNQEAFIYGATEEIFEQRGQSQACLDYAESRKNSGKAQFGMRDNHFEEEGEIISRDTIEQSIDGENAEAYRIMLGDKKVGGVVISVTEGKGDLELLFVSPKAHSKGIGYKAWCEVERLHPEVKVWETVTPYFETRNIHFYVNRCGFHIVEFYNSHHPDPNDHERMEDDNDGMFRFQKIIPSSDEQ